METTINPYLYDGPIPNTSDIYEARQNIISQLKLNNYGTTEVGTLDIFSSGPIDLSGVDVARKILILIRESGYQMEIEDITNKSFMPAECLATTNNDDFFASLKTHAVHFENLLKENNKFLC